MRVKPPNSAKSTCLGKVHYHKNASAVLEEETTWCGDRSKIGMHSYISYLTRRGKCSRPCGQEIGSLQYSQYLTTKVWSRRAELMEGITSVIKPIEKDEEVMKD